jgi:hypothetical protein
MIKFYIMMVKGEWKTMARYPGSGEKVEGVESIEVHLWSDGTRLWGTSYGGGKAVYVAAHNERVKCLVTRSVP